MRRKECTLFELFRSHPVLLDAVKYCSLFEWCRGKCKDFTTVQPIFFRAFSPARDVNIELTNGIGLSLK